MIAIRIPYGGFTYAGAGYYGYRHGIVLGWWLIMWGKP
jgi:hypothetical protein